MENIQNLYKLVETLHMIHKQSSLIEHGIKLNNDWIEYIPTKFIYVIFVFNTLYNIEWFKSVERGDIYSIVTDKNDPEYDMIKLFDKYNGFSSRRKINGERLMFRNMIDFCFQDSKFVDEYYHRFRNMALVAYSHSEIAEKIETITPDNYTFLESPEQKRRSNINQIEVRNFKKAYYEFLQGEFTKENTIQVVDFIYLIRCNIFHGTKSLKDMTTEVQKAKLQIYSDYIIALNQMLFSYLDYRCGKLNYDQLLKEEKYNPSYNR